MTLALEIKDFLGHEADDAAGEGDLGVGGLEGVVGGAGVVLDAVQKVNSHVLRSGCWGICEQR